MASIPLIVCVLETVGLVLLTMLGTVHLHWMDGQVIEMDQKGVPCPDVEHVCGSLLKVQNREAEPEGTYCSCDGCDDPLWDESDGRAFTWYHHEKNHWQIQYRFCEPIIPKQQCRNGEEMAAVIRTDSKGWNPRIRKLYCRCPNNRYFLQGWNLVEERYWDYHYVCDRPMCEEHESDDEEIDPDPVACVKRYYDKVGEKTVGYRFLCSCIDGKSCPTEFQNDYVPEIEGEDNTGPFVTGYCVAGAVGKQKPLTRR